jgi:sodium/hydrogen antiporter
LSQPRDYCHVSWNLAIVACCVLLVATVSRRLTNTPVTAPMVFVALGLLVGPLVINELELTAASATVRTLAEATLAVVLFVDASRIKLGALERESAVPLRLLGVGLPLTILVGALAAALLFAHLTVAEAVVLAVVLAPTDAALGQAVVTEPRLPSRVRQGLNVESGLNDGICVPLLLIALAIAGAEAGDGHGAVQVIAEAIGWGLVGGIVGGLAAAGAVTLGRSRQLLAESWLQVIPVAAAALAYGVAAALGGSGFIAAFVAGGVFGALAGGVADEASAFSEELGGLLGGVTLLIFGAALLGPALEDLTWRIAAYALLSLTVARMLPVAIALLGSRARRPTIGFLGWFGPRGLASIVFAVIVVEEAAIPGAHTIVTTAYVTVGLSVFAHGVSAAPLADRYARWFESHPNDRRPAMENGPAPYRRPRGR